MKRDLISRLEALERAAAASPSPYDAALDRLNKPELMLLDSLLRQPAGDGRLLALLGRRMDGVPIEAFNPDDLEFLRAGIEERVEKDVFPDGTVIWCGARNRPRLNVSASAPAPVRDGR